MKRPSRRRTKPVPVEHPPVEPPPTQTGPRRWTWAETRVQLALVEQRIAGMHSQTSIVDELRELHGVGRQRAQKLMERVRAAWAKQDEQQRESWRSEQVRSVRATIARLNARINNIEVRRNPETGEVELTGKSPIGLYQVKARYEELLMELTGTRMPEQVEVHHTGSVTHTLQAVVASMTPEEASEALAEYQETQRLAEIGRTAITVLPNGKVRQ